LNTTIGGRARTNVAQAIANATPTLLTNNGTVAWTAVEDSGGFVSATGGTNTPLSVPAGQGGAYLIGVGYINSVNATTRGYVSIFVNGALANANSRAVFTGDAVCSYTIIARLSVGDTVGVQVYTSPLGNASVGCDVYAYKLGN
jgi:hypothetical protein